MSTLQTKKSYHHGDLRNALVAEAVSAARVDGPAAVVLRDIARRVGVSHNAGYRHFANREDLLGAVAEVGLAELAAGMRHGIENAADPGDPAAQARLRLRAIGRAYVDYALAEPGLFRSIWAAAAYPAAHQVEGPASGPPAIPGSTAETLATSSDPYQLLNAVLDEMVAAGAIPASRRAHSETVAWAGVHGLATLLIDGPLGVMPPSEIDAAFDRLTDVIDAGL